MTPQQREKCQEFIQKALEEVDPPPSVHDILKRLAHARLPTPHGMVKEMRNQKLVQLAAKPLTQNLGDKLLVVAPRVVVRPKVPYAERPIADRPLDRVIDEVAGTVEGSQFTAEEREKGMRKNMDNAAERMRWAEDYALSYPAVSADELHNHVVAKFGIGVRLEKLRDLVLTMRDLQKGGTSANSVVPRQPKPNMMVGPAKLPESVKLEPSNLVFVDTPPPARGNAGTAENQMAKKFFADLLNNPGKWALVPHEGDKKAGNRLAQAFKRLGAEALQRGPVLYARFVSK